MLDLSRTGNWFLRSLCYNAVPTLLLMQVCVAAAEFPQTDENSTCNSLRECLGFILDNARGNSKVAISLKSIASLLSQNFPGTGEDQIKLELMNYDDSLMGYNEMFVQADCYRPGDGEFQAVVFGNRIIAQDPKCINYGCIKDEVSSIACQGS